MSQKCVGGRGLISDPAGGAYSAGFDGSHFAVRKGTEGKEIWD